VLNDEIEKDLHERYNMDPKVWRKAQRHGFPYNIPLDYIVGIPLFAPLAFLIFDLAIIDRKSLWTVIQTIGVSVAAYLISDKLIDAFKESLEKKGLFGRDLNKAGVQAEKKPV
jgi:hypothetical protein